jgi:hypothetical protein
MSGVGDGHWRFYEGITMLDITLPDGEPLPVFLFRWLFYAALWFAVREFLLFLGEADD